MIYFNDSLRQIAAGSFVLLLDVDDVMVDAGQSFPRAIARAARRFLQELNLPAEGPLDDKIRAIKRCPGFNDDWDTAQALTLYLLQKQSPQPKQWDEWLNGLRPPVANGLQSHPPAIRDWLAPRFDSDRIRKLAQAFYAGPEWCQTLYGFDTFDFVDVGAMAAEILLVDPDRLKRLTAPWGIYTGRNRRELQPVLNRMNMPAPDACFCLGDTPWAKPDPEPLFQALNQTGARGVIFAGDNPDDRQTVVNFHRQNPGTPAAFVRINGGGCPHFPEDSWADSVNQLLDLLIKEDATCENRH